MKRLKPEFTIPRRCTIAWTDLTGEGHSRLCQSCGRDVHDFAQMTQDEAARLVEHAREPVCGRVVYEANGTTLFAEQWSTFARFVQISAVGLSVSSANAQQHVQSPLAMSSNERCSARVTVLDPTGAAVPGARIVFAQTGRAEINKGATDQNGMFRADLPAGQYTLHVEAPGLAPYVDQHLSLACVSDRQPKEVSVSLNVGWVGTIVEVKHYGPLRRLWIRLKSLTARL